MFKKIHIENYKSIKKLSFDAKRINLFIGGPNTGKSNIIEALGLFDPYQYNLKETIRFKEISNLFFDNEITNTIKLTADNIGIELLYKGGVFIEAFKIYDKANNPLLYSWELREDGTKIERFEKPVTQLKTDFSVHNYHYKVIDKFINTRFGNLMPPFGANLFAVLRSNKKVREFISSIFKKQGYRLNLRLKDSEIEIIKEEDDILYSYPYQSISDTLQRIIFYETAILTNKDTVILFEEPEAHTFPFYTKQLAEMIALDENNNQYFIVTHNPYLLTSIIEKATIKDVAVFVTDMKDYQTILRKIKENEYSELLELDSDIFFNLKKLSK